MLAAVEYRGQKLAKSPGGKTVKVGVIQVDSIVLHASKQVPQVKEISDPLDSLSDSEQCNTTLFKKLR